MWYLGRRVQAFQKKSILKPTLFPSDLPVSFGTRGCSPLASRCAQEGSPEPGPPNSVYSVLFLLQIPESNFEPVFFSGWPTVLVRAGWRHMPADV